MADVSPDDVTVSFRFKQEHHEQNYPQRLLAKAQSQGMTLNEFARQMVIESLEDDRLEHISALVQQLHSKVRQLEQATEQLRKNQKKGMMAILIHVCNMSPDQAQQLLRGEQPL